MLIDASQVFVVVAASSLKELYENYNVVIKYHFVAIYVK